MIYLVGFLVLAIVGLTVAVFSLKRQNTLIEQYVQNLEKRHVAAYNVLLDQITELGNQIQDLKTKPL